MPRPTPGGVPVAMMSPGSNVMYWLTCEMIFATSNTMVRVFPLCIFLPWLVTADEIRDPQSLDMLLEVNGKKMQSGNTRTMVFDVAKIISHVSQYMTLLPGDIIATGTPPGVGLGIKPTPVFLKPGDVMRLTIAGLGEQKQRVVAYSA